MPSSSKDATPSSVLQVSRHQARLLLLKKQFLWPPRSLQGRQGLLSYLERVRMVQYDPVNLVGTNPCITINARVKDFKPQMLEDMLYRDRLLFDHWDRCASIVLLEDLPPLQRNRSDTNWRARSRRPVPPSLYKKVKNRLAKSEEALTTSSFSDIDEREALLLLLAKGEVEIHHREGPRRFFTLTPDSRKHLYSDRSYFNSEDEFFAWMIKRRIGSTGLLAGLSSIGLHSIVGLNPTAKRRVHQQLLNRGEICELQVDDSKMPYYCLPDDMPLMQEDKALPPKACFLAPLDNLLWDRRMIEDLFNFSYRWEIYTKDDKRVYGPYTLPVLYGEEIIARTQLQLDENMLRVTGWWWQAAVKPTKKMLHAVEAALKAHATMLGTIAVSESLANALD